MVYLGNAFSNISCNTSLISSGPMTGQDVFWSIYPMWRINGQYNPICMEAVISEAVVGSSL